MVRALCFDLMDTLLVDPYQEALRAGLGSDRPPGGRDPDAWPAFEVAAIDEAEFVRRFAGGAPFDIEAFHGVRRAGYRWLPGMRELVAACSGRATRHVASNYPVWIDELRASFGLDEVFDGVWSSHRFGVRKPDPEFYARLCAAVGQAPADCLLIDDRERNVVAALEAGLEAHLFVDAGSTAARLRAEGILA